ncbi:hypothetical protein HYH02_006843 [Chlamydomonas schloesseri]|uniref:SRCR domain-containing protein n=1 Tax=Chlamydomonas schloesseri TaxID=2026947 RepID=A0A835WIH3_9CHLO|nr:hypothetical protein HYH02_006843 [Chlamydomonas schloesseri]|eukprot:KAG2448259.1 hypothetical protein HYH02_006843 [Chlamydomonas schloesseri]
MRPSVEPPASGDLTPGYNGHVPYVNAAPPAAEFDAAPPLAPSLPPSPPLAPSPPPWPTSPPTRPPADGDVRLVGGRTRYEGRLEVLYRGTYGSVCDDRFTDAAAAVACAQLGLSGGRALCCGAFNGPAAGGSPPPVLLDEVVCSGNETALAQCVHNDWGTHDCELDEAVAVRCEPPPLAPSGSSGGGIPFSTQASAAQLAAVIASRDTCVPPPVKCSTSPIQHLGRGCDPALADSTYFANSPYVNAMYRLVYVYPDGSRSCPAKMQPLHVGGAYVQVKWQLDQPRARRDPFINGQPRALLLQRRGSIGDSSGTPGWMTTQWMDALRYNDVSSKSLLDMVDRGLGFDMDALDMSPAGPLAAGWRWKHGSSGNTDGYSPATFPELTAAVGASGINTTYQLVYQIFEEYHEGYHSYPGMSRFAVQHAASSTPLLLYVQLASGTHPANMRALLLQRVEGDSVWTVASLGADSEEITSGRTALVFRDVTSRDTWGCPDPNHAQQQQPVTQPPSPLPSPSLLAPFVLPSEPVFAPVPAPRPPTADSALVCRLAIRGRRQPADEGSDGIVPQQMQLDLQSASLHCTTSRQQQGGDGEGAAAPSQPPVQVEVGPLLAPLLLSDPSRTSGVQVIVANAAGDALLQQRWGVAFLGPLPQFSLVDSVVEDVPLSPSAPLVECRGCEEVVLRNVSLRRLAPLAPDRTWAPEGDQQPYNTHGAVLLSGVRRLAADGLVCAEVSGAHGFACLLVDIEDKCTAAAAATAVVAELSFSDCAMDNNTVVRATDLAPTSAEPLRRLLGASDSGLLGAGAVALVGGMCSSVAGVWLTRTSLSGNRGGCGAALYSSLNTVAAVLVDSHLNGNVVEQGSGAAVFLSCSSSGDVNLSTLMLSNGSTINDNRAGSNGGAVYVCGEMGSIRITGPGSAMDNNTAASSTADVGGGAVYAGHIATVVLTDGASLSGNSASGDGGALLVGGEVSELLALRGSRADRNMAGKSGGVVMLKGGGRPGLELTVSGRSSMSGNVARSGSGGIFWGYAISAIAVADFSAMDDNWAGGAASVAGTPWTNWDDKPLRYFTVTGYSSVNNNSADNSGILSLNSILKSVLVANNSHMDGNTARVGSAAVLSAYSVDIFHVTGNSSVDRNVATDTNARGGTINAGGIGTVLVTAGGSISHNYGGPAINCMNMGRITVSDPGSRVANNTAVSKDGGAFSVDSLKVLEVLDGGSMLNNTALSGSGGAVGITVDVGRITVRGGTVSSNAAHKRAGAFSVGGYVTGDVEVSGGASVEDNVATLQGGGFLAVSRAVQGELVVAGAGTRVCGCSAGGGSGGAVFVGGDGVFGGVAVTGGAVLCNNTAQEDGGALYLGFGTPTIAIEGRGSGVLGNSAGRAGGALFARGAVSTLELSGGAALADNAAGEDGGAVTSVLLGSLRLAGSASVSGNRAGGDGGAMSFRRLTLLEVSGGGRAAGNQAGRSGGFVSLATLPDNITVTGGSQLLRNTALRGAGGAINIEVPEPGAALLSQVAPNGAAVLVVSGGARLAENSAYTDGGVIYVAAAASPSPTSTLANSPQVAHTVLLQDVDAHDNFAGGAGGVLAVSSPAAGALDSRVAVRSSRLYNNTAGSTLFRLGSSVASGYGGALAVSSAPKFRADAVMEQAHAGGGGSADGAGSAAAFAAAHGNLDSACVLVLVGVSFEANRCQGLGGAVAAVSCPTLIRNCSFTQNVARLGGGGVAGMVEAIVAKSVNGTSSSARRRGLQQQLLLPSGGMTRGEYHADAETWLEVHNSSFVGNFAELDCGGGVYAEVVRGAGARLADSEVTGNAALEHNGGGVCVVGKGRGASAVLERMNLRGNSASRLGGALFASLGDSGSAVTVTGCELSGNGAGRGGAAAVQAAAGSVLRLTDSILRSNMASTDGGALLSECDPAAATACGDGLAAGVASNAVVSVSGCALTGNAARSGRGGALYVSGGSSATVLNSSISGSWAGDSGAGVAAVGCAALVMGGGSSVSNSSALRFGGGLFAYSCSRVQVQDATVEGNHAATGAGLFLAGPSSSGLLEALLVQPWSGTALVLVERANVTGNVANRTAAGQQVQAAQDASGVEQQDPQAAAANYAAVAAATSGGYQRYGGHGGGVFVHGDVAVMLQDVDASAGNTALVGAALGSTQQCDAASAAVDAAAVLSSSGSNAWGALANLTSSDGSCWPLVMSNVSTPPAQSSPVWTQDAAASTLRVTCPQLQQQPAAGAASSSGSTAAACSLLPAAALRRACQLQRDLSTCGRRSARDAAAAIASVTTGMLELPPTHMRLEAVTVTDSDGQQRQLYVSGSGSGSGSGTSAATAPTTGGLQLRPGSTFTLSVRLYNDLGQPTQRDTLAWKVTVSLEPAYPNANPNQTPNNSSSAHLRTSPLLPWQDVDVANLDPGAASGSSLTADVGVGLATWPTLTARGWTGDYQLAFDATAVEDAGLYQVAQLRLPLKLLPCAPGEALDLEWARAAWGRPSWAACSACGRGRFTLWRDTRPALTDPALAGADYYSRMKSISEAAVEGDAACLSCPAHATCPGGAVVVPEPGYWHSAPDSAWVHRCPQTAACGDSSHLLQDWPSLSLLPNSTSAASNNANASTDALGAAAQVVPAFSDTRSETLGWCQLSAYGRQLAGSVNVTALRSLSCDAWGPAIESSSIHSDVGVSAAAAAATTGYLAAQCAQGYTGHLCGACQPGYYGNAELECNACPSEARTIGLAILSFLGSVLLVLYTAFTNLQENSAAVTAPESAAASSPPASIARPSSGKARHSGPTATATKSHQRAKTGAEEELGASEVLKVLIVHIQYYIIITRLPIPYPSSITRTAAVVTSLTGAESSIAYSPSCLFPEQGSGGQARTQVLAALLIPCVVVAVCLCLWALRYLMLNRARFRRAARISRKASQGAFSDLPVFVEAPASGDVDSSSSSGAAAAAVSPDASAQDSGSMALPPTPKSDQQSPSIIYNPLSASTISCYSDGSRQQVFATQHAKARSQPLQQQSQADLNSSASFAAAAAASPTSHGGSADSLRWRGGGRLSRLAGSGTTRLRAAVSGVRSQLSGSLKNSAMARTMQHVDQTLQLPAQLGIVLMCAVFIMYPGWANAALSLFTCYRIDDGKSGPFPDRQQAAWPLGYWIRDLQQQCYAGTHMLLYVPIGIASFLLFCVVPPAASFLLLWRRRRDLDTAEVQQRYGFLYSRYKPRYFYWESVLMLQELALVAVEVFGRSLEEVAYQVLLMLAAFLVLGVMNMACSPVRSHAIELLEFMSLAVLSLTLTLSLYFITGNSLQAASANVIGWVIMAINLALLAAFVWLLLRQSWAAARTKLAGPLRSARSKALQLKQRALSARRRGPDGRGAGKGAAAAAPQSGLPQRACTLPTADNSPTVQDAAVVAHMIGSPGFEPPRGPGPAAYGAPLDNGNGSVQTGVPTSAEHIALALE